ncbi:MAG: hypothetical protein GX589_05105 [Deltaproteobacteria bacterium]|nr:hypothetical protein [Deltaproteobacteria bacterium]
MRSDYRNDTAFTVIELLAVLGLMVAVSAIAVSQLQQLNDPLEDSTAELVSFFKQVRARAISTTSAYTVVPLSSSEVVTHYSATCGDEDTTDDSRLTLDLPTGVRLSDTDWSVCYNSRGLPDDNVLIELSAAGGRGRFVEVFLGGAVKEVDGD